MQASAHPDFCQLCLYVATQCTDVDILYRSSAIAVLKNHMGREYDRIDKGSIKLILEKTMGLVVHENNYIRNIAGNIISIICCREGIGSCPQVIDVLMKWMQSGNVNERKGGFNALNNLLSDCGKDLSKDEFSEKLCPLLLQMFKCNDTDLLVLIVKAMNKLLVHLPNCIVKNVLGYVDVWWWGFG